MFFDLPELVRYIYHKISINPREIGVRWPPIWLWGTTCNMPLLNSWVVVVVFFWSKDFDVAFNSMFKGNHITYGCCLYASTETARFWDCKLWQKEKNIIIYVFIREAIVQGTWVPARDWLLFWLKHDDGDEHVDLSWCWQSQHGTYFTNEPLEFHCA